MWMLILLTQIKRWAVIISGGSRPPKDDPQNAYILRGFAALAAKKCCRRTARITGTALIALSIFAPRVHACFMGVGCSTEVTQILNNVELLKQNMTLAEQLKKEMDMLADMVHNSKNIPLWVWGRLESDQAQLASLLRQGQSIAYSAGEIDQIFRQRFPGYALPGATFYSQYKSWNATAMDTIQGSLGLAKARWQQMQFEQNDIQQLRRVAMGQDARNASIQTVANITEYQVEQLHKLQAIVMAQANTQGVYYGYVLQKEAVKKALAEKFFNYAAQPGTGYKGY
jgi:type IV secretion system protein TrbJ